MTGWVVLAPVAVETIVLPSSFLPCIPSHNAMKSKLPFRTKRAGVACGKDEGEDPSG